MISAFKRLEQKLIDVGVIAMTHPAQKEVHKLRTENARLIAALTRISVTTVPINGEQFYREVADAALLGNPLQEAHKE